MDHLSVFLWRGDFLADYFHLTEEATAAGSCHRAALLVISLRMHPECCRCSTSKGGPHLHKEGCRMLGACHHPHAPQSHDETLMPPVCPAEKGPPPQSPSQHCCRWSWCDRQIPSASAVPDAWYISAVKRGEVLTR